MSSLQTNHVLEIEPGEECWAWILLCFPLPHFFTLSFLSFALLSTTLTLFFSLDRSEIWSPPPCICTLLLFLGHFFTPQTLFYSLSSSLSLLVALCWARECSPVSSTLDCLLSHKEVDFHSNWRALKRRRQSAVPRPPAARPAFTRAVMTAHFPQPHSLLPRWSCLSLACRHISELSHRQPGSYKQPATVRRWKSAMCEDADWSRHFPVW